VTSPVKARLRPQRFPAGLGARHVLPSLNAPSRNAQNAGPTTNNSLSKQSRPTVYRRVPESSSSLPADTTTATRRSSEHSLNREHRLDIVPDEASHDGPSGPPGVDPRSTHGSKSHYVGGTREVNIAKTPPSTMQHRPDSSQSTTSPQEVEKICLLDSRATPVSPNLLPPFLPIPPRPTLPPVDSRASAPVNPPLIDVHSVPIQPIPPQSPPTPGIPYVTRIRGKAAVIGMPQGEAKAGRMRGYFFKVLEPPANPSRSVVMEILPRKFRTQSFILDWLSQFRFQPSRYELVEGKVFFEFETESDAHLAWHSPRMGGPDGLLCVRLFWYRILPQSGWEKTDKAQKINAKGTIEDPARPQLQSVSDLSTSDLGPEEPLELKADLSPSHIPTHKSTSHPSVPPPSTINVKDPKEIANSLAKDIKSSPDNETSPGTSSSKHTVRSSSIPAPTATTGPLAIPTQPNHPLDDQMIEDSAVTGDFPPDGVSCFFPSAPVSPTLVSTPLPTISSSTLASSTAFTSSAVFPTFSPVVLDPSVAATSVHHQVPPMALNQELIEAPRLASEISHSGTEVERTEFEKDYEPHPQTDSLMDTMDTGALAKEQSLREMVLQSRKRKLLQAPNSQQSTSATALTGTSGSALDQLAANFIADAIARPPPAKRVKITPSQLSMAVWRSRLEQHIQSSKAIMEKIDSSESKTERNTLMAILRENERCVSR